MGSNNLFSKVFRGKKKENLKTLEQIEELLGGRHSDEQKMFINKGQDDQMEIFYYRASRAKTALTYLGFIFTCGVLRLIYHWFPYLYLYSTSVNCKINEAEKILIVELYDGKHKSYHIKPLQILTPEAINKMKFDDDRNQNSNENLEVPPFLSVHMEKGEFREVDKLLMFSLKKVTYLYDSDKQEFLKLAGLDTGVPCDVFHKYKPLNSSENLLRRLVYGPNIIRVKESSILQLLFLEVLNPFYIFQLSSFILWFSDQYYYYAAAIMLMSIVSIVITVRQIKKNERNLKSTVHSKDTCTVLRRSFDTADSELNDKGYISQQVYTDNLVPGDILEIPSNGCIMHCDAVLLNGSCILNESMLTGESVPVTKTALPSISSLNYDPKEHARHTIFCGTEVSQTRCFGNEKVLAVVIRTGFSTTKGNLVRSILYPPPVDFRFEKDSYKFVGFLALVAGIGFVYTLIQKIIKGVPAGDIALQALDLITIVVPPALPAAMTMGRVYAQKSLKKQGIFCISPRTINVSGGINCICFDKTGTLTEDGLDLLCVVPAANGAFKTPEKIVKTMDHDTLFYGLVSCHSLTTIKNEIAGDPLDLKMFQSTEWVVDEPDVADINKFDVIFPTVLKPPNNTDAIDETASDNQHIGILREFPFSSSCQRMGVIVRRLNATHFEYYCKGSPERILNYVNKDTVPVDFHDVLEHYAHQGYRVIALAHKELKLRYAKVQKVQREALEEDLTFLGFLVFENKLKPDTTSCIKILNEANMRIIMVTGDNILTALSVAKHCEIILPNQTVITVNSDSAHPPSIYYTVSDEEPSRDYSVMSNSASVVSLETVESQLQTNSANTVRDNDVEAGNGAIRSTNSCNNYRFAMTGKTWGAIKEHYPELLPKICTRGTVFARMSPEQKQQLVHELQNLGYCVAMCGDGANDCGALKAAHTGISLSEAEASVASPFTSKNPNITCVLHVIREGRAALVTSFGLFKYMASYSLCQFVSVLILYSIESNLTDLEFLYIDLALISVFAFFFGKTEAYSDKIDKNTPMSSLISLSPLMSLSLQMLLVIVFQVSAFQFLKTKSWYVPFEVTDPDELACIENYTIFTVSSFQYIILAIVFSKGAPYRKPIFSNWWFLGSIIIMTIVSVYLAICPDAYSMKYLELVVPEDMYFRYYLLGWAMINFVVSFLIEQYLIEHFVFKKWRLKFHDVEKSKKKYLAIERDLNKDSTWPKLSSNFKSAASPLNPTPECRREIVFEKENKFDKNHVLNNLYENAKGITTNPSSTFTTPTHITTTPNHYYSTPNHQKLANHETGYFSQENLDFSSLPSENFSSPSRSETFKSLSNNQSSYDMASSHINIPDIPFDDSPTTDLNIERCSQFNAFNNSESPPENFKLELNNFNISR